jgi:serine/threonine protein phosphatase 1
MTGLLRKMFGARPAPATVADAPKARILSLRTPPAAIYAVGDVHGCRALYQRLEAMILQDAATQFISGPVLIVLLGDIVDRGPDSAGVIDDLQQPAPQGVQRLVLRGNHEEMMLRFLTDPGPNRDWLVFGGNETLASYGVMSDLENGFDLSPTRSAAMLETTIPAPHRAFLASLPYGLHVGEYFLCHAGIDPARPLSEQTPHDLIWGPPDRIDAASPAQNLPIIVHGHVIVPEVHLRPRRINVDTGAYISGKLSAVRLRPDEPPFVLSVQGKAV